jgi:hypothetical protein
VLFLSYESIVEINENFFVWTPDWHDLFQCSTFSIYNDFLNNIRSFFHKHHNYTTTTIPPLNVGAGGDDTEEQKIKKKKKAGWKIKQKGLPMICILRKKNVFFLYHYQIDNFFFQKV